MKKSEAAKKLTEFALKKGFEIEQRPDFSKLSEDEGHTLLSDAILTFAVDELGMLPPTNTCKLVDDGKGGQKHSASERKWDEE